MDPNTNIRWTQKDLNETLEHVFKNVDAGLKNVLKAIGEFVRDQNEPLKKRLAELEAKVAALEEGGIKYCGVYQRAIQYKRGDVVTFDGSLWCAIANPQQAEIPSKSLNWQLAVKHGKDAKPPVMV